MNWTGFYVLDRHASGQPSKASPLSSKTLRKPARQLVLGPFQGKVACQTIVFGKGVCGTAAERAKVVRVADVEQFPGHIACDAESKSEIVVPVVAGGEVRDLLSLLYFFLLRGRDGGLVCFGDMLVQVPQRARVLGRWSWCTVLVFRQGVSFHGYPHWGIFASGNGIKKVLVTGELTCFRS